MPSKKYTYSKRAERDLIKIYQDTARKWGIAQADKYDNGLEKTVNHLGVFQDSCHLFLNFYAASFFSVARTRFSGFSVVASTGSQFLTS